MDIEEQIKWLRAGQQVGAHYKKADIQKIPKSILDESADSIERLLGENKELHEKVAFLESREVCTAPHENIDGCPYCKNESLHARNQLLERVAEAAEAVVDNALITTGTISEGIAPESEELEQALDNLNGEGQ